MRRIAFGAKSRLHSQFFGSGLLVVLLANAAWADEPATEQQAAPAPKSGVVIRLQLHPSTPEPQTQAESESQAEPELEQDGGPEPDKIPATAVQFRRKSKDFESSRSSRMPAGPLPRRLAPRRIESAPAAPSRGIALPITTRQPAPTTPQLADRGTSSTLRLPTATNQPAPTKPLTGTQSILNDRTVLELSADPKASAPKASAEPSLETPSAEIGAGDLTRLELAPREALSSENRLSKLESQALDDSQTLNLQPPQEPNANSSESIESLDADDGLTLDAQRSLTLSGAGSANQVKTLDLDFSNERPLESLADESELRLEPDDVPLEQEPHPFDAPPAESIAPIIKRSMVDAEEFSERERRIEAGIARCLSYYVTHPENTTRRGPWALMHAALPFGVEGEVLAGNRRVNTIGWLSYNGTSAKQHMFQPTRTGFRPNVGPGMQGHEGQFLAILAQSDVRSDYPLQINGRRYTVMDLARYEMATCREKSELTFKLIGLSRYLEPNQRWSDNRGRPWTVEKMLAEELAQPVNGAACGGVHRLMGLSYAIVERQASGQPLTGNWQRAETYLNNYVQYTMTLQNPDGSFSTNWFESRGMNPDIERRVQTSGHILEWLVYTLPDDHLRSPRIEQAIEFLLNTIGREPQRDWPIGPRGHALRAMALYSQRVFGAQSGQLKSYLAQVPQTASIR